jgi:hypothetical protein
MSSNHPHRRHLLGALAAIGGLVLSGCDRLASEPRLRSVLDAANSLTYKVQRLLIGVHRLAPEYSEADISPAFRPNEILSRAGVRPEARFVVFHCADTLDDGESSVDPESTRYYESIDLIDAAHPQTILAYDMNGKPLTVPHGAPLRLRLERQLGYKMANTSCASSWCRASPICMAAAAAIGKIGVMSGTRGYEALPLMRRVFGDRVVWPTVLDRKPCELPKASCGLEGRAQRATAASSHAGHEQLVGKVLRGKGLWWTLLTPPRHDISVPRDPGHCFGARHERAAKNRFRD